MDAVGNYCIAMSADADVAGIPCLDGMNPQGGGIHSLNEFGYLASLPEAAKQVATILYNL